MAETWVFNETPSATGTAMVWSVNFVSNGQAFTKLTRTSANIRYQNETLIVVYVVKTTTWSDESYRTVTFEEAPSGTLLEWLTVAATKVPAKRINRVDLNGETVLDLTADTVTPETLDAGVTAHNAAGEAIVGTRVPFVVADNAGAHNAIYRGKNLGSEVTAAQWAAIGAGTFEDLFIGDYWEINGVVWRIAAFDYYVNTGDVLCTTHHAVIVPDTSLYEAAMNSAQSTAGGYVGSTMYTTGLNQAKTMINNAFGSAHILSHRQALCTTVTNGVPTGYGFYDSTVELMTEQNVFGGKFYGAAKTTTQTPSLMTMDNTQYPLFAYRHDLIAVPDKWWGLRDIVSASNYARVTPRCSPDWTANIAGNIAVRPAFSIKA